MQPSTSFTLTDFFYIYQAANFSSPNRSSSEFSVLDLFYIWEAIHSITPGANVVDASFFPVSDGTQYLNGELRQVGSNVYIGSLDSIDSTLNVHRNSGTDQKVLSVTSNDLNEVFVAKADGRCYFIGESPDQVTVNIPPKDDFVSLYARGSNNLGAYVDSQTSTALQAYSASGQFTIDSSNDGNSSTSFSLRIGGSSSGILTQLQSSNRFARETMTKNDPDHNSIERFFNSNIGEPGVVTFQNVYSESSSPSTGEGIRNVFLQKTSLGASDLTLATTVILTDHRTPTATSKYVITLRNNGIQADRFEFKGNGNLNNLAGDFITDTVGKGFVTRSPDGTYWRIGVDNGGGLVADPV